MSHRVDPNLLFELKKFGAVGLEKCINCGNQVPASGQCNKCGIVDGLQRKPSNEEFKEARRINAEHNYKQFTNIDMLLLDE